MEIHPANPMKKGKYLLKIPKKRSSLCHLGYSYSKNQRYVPSLSYIKEITHLSLQSTKRLFWTILVSPPYQCPYVWEISHDSFPNLEMQSISCMAPYFVNTTTLLHRHGICQMLYTSKVANFPEKNA